MKGTIERPIIRGVVDTHAVIWYHYADPRLSQTAYDFMEAVDAVGDRLAISSITFSDRLSP